MLIALSPAKSLDFETNFMLSNKSSPIFLKDTQKLVAELKKFSIEDLKGLMSISENLAKLNFARFQSFNHTKKRQAILAFDGDVYDGIDKKNYDLEDFNFAQNHLIILSGLYGFLRPLDEISPYRLEMGTDFKKTSFISKNLYEFWGDKITLEINKTKSQYLINLASNEYFQSINRKICNKKIIDIIFKEKKGGVYKIIGINAKRARGLMANFIIKNKILNPNDLRDFKLEKYQFSSQFSDSNQLVFIR